MIAAVIPFGKPEIGAADLGEGTIRGRTIMEVRYWRRLGHCRRMPAAKDLKFGGPAVMGGYRSADVQIRLAASKAASRSANLPFAAPARAMMVGVGKVSKK
jgi:hypothetical protein